MHDFFCCIRQYRFALLIVTSVLLVTSSVVARSNAGAGKEAQAGHSATEINAQYVGSQTCQGCHDQLYTQFESSPHWLTTKETRLTPGAHGCESCHGPGSAHVEDGGDVSKIFTFKKVSPEQINARCVGCHQQDQERANWTRGAHAINGVSCVECHSPHHSRVQQSILVDSTPQLCYRCHTETRADFSKPFRHRVNEGLVQCQDCHNVHGAYVLRRSLRQTASQEETCYKCHRDKQGPWLFEHSPVKADGCVTCHTPHGSVNARLLRVAPVNLLCLQCHSPAPSSATPAVPSFHNQLQKYQACTLCHPSIHGSNASETFEY
ncbi:MAG: DmsE family decaheme c-type cytochrome [Terriglobales bacterium]